MVIFNLYQSLHERLKGAGIEWLIKRVKERSLTDYEEEALRIIARLPHPSFASIEQIVAVCKECSMGHLEFAFQVDRTGEIARQILKRIQEHEEKREEIKRPPEFLPFPERYDIPSIGNMLAWSNKMMLHLVRQTDIALKGRCPECSGDLVEDIVFNNSTQKHELRLRCKQLNKPKCQQVDFYIHDLT